MHIKQLLAKLPPPLRSLAIAGPGADYRRSIDSPARLHEPSPEDQRIPERFVQDIWGSRLFDPSRLRLADGRPISVIDPGTHNHDAGPDFTNARVRIGDLDWRGDVEIHFRSSDWVAHRHQFDERYNSVVLHVSFVEDFWTGRLTRPDGTAIPEVVLRSALAMPLRKLVVTLNSRDPHNFPCESQWSSVPDDLKHGWIGRLGRERLEEKKSLFEQLLLEAGSLDELLYRELMRGLGYSKNCDSFYELSCRIPLALLRQVASPTPVEALLFGVAGLTSASDSAQHPRVKTTTPESPERDHYREGLAVHFERTNALLKIPVMSPLQWNFFRLRPTNFPTLRIAQSVGWFGTGGLLYQRSVESVIEAARDSNPTGALRALLATAPSRYWETHYRFDAESFSSKRLLGRRRTDALIGNVILPLMLLVSEQRSDRGLAQAVVRIFEALPTETNQISRVFSEAGFRSRSAIEAGGLQQLYRTRCDNAGCLSCPIGRYLLRADLQSPI